MRRSYEKKHDSRALWLSFLLVSLGCGVSGTNVNPSADVARESLDRVLASWQAGKPPIDLQAGTPPIHAVVDPWVQGRKLSSYEILQARESGTDKRFQVRLSLIEPAQEVLSDYIVIGTGPIWVYTEDDFNRTMSMDNNPSSKNRPRGPAGRGATSGRR